MSELAGRLLPLVVAAPLAVAAIMLATAHLLPPKVPDVIAIATAAAVAGLCGWLAVVASGIGPAGQWFGGWTPVGGIRLGILFVGDPASATMAGLCAVVVALSTLFAWGFFDEVHAHFHVLMLLFLAAMVGFCLTQDLFNLFVWFELMSVAAYALTAYKLAASSLEGALNFTVVNSFASIAMLAGVGLLYARAGQLDMTAMGQALARDGRDPLVAGGFCLVATALLTKAAVVPFQAWLADAHGVAPSPVSVVFSAVMVPLGLFGLAKLDWLVFAHCEIVQSILRDLLLPLGCATAVTGGLMAWLQRHLKRLLGFSTVAHMGVVLIGLTSRETVGAAGFLAYATGHAMVKGALFMVAGVLLSLRSSNDELVLRGKGAGLGPTGWLMAAAGLLLAGAPLGVMHAGDSLVGHAGEIVLPVWAEAAIVLGGALTGGAVLRAAGRIFLGLGAAPGLEVESPTEPEREKATRPLWLMLLPCALLLLADFWPASWAEHASLAAAVASGRLPAAVSPPELPPLISGLVSTVLALSFAAVALGRARWPRWLRRGGEAAAAMVRPLRDLHSGLVGDYLSWTAVGMAALVVAALLA
ncbi:MAG: NADH dehydrogenase [Alphaproteobacteria bacterium]|nr:NADH dehydrogenase [Alphaproteobacteria bacterium]